MTDYTKIRNDNIEEYGKGTRHLAFLGNLYSDRTHFIYELLQNAEDAGAKKIHFNLFHSRIEVLHDGRPFDTADVKGVCGVGEGTKNEDLTKIGKFGIGFKSIYAYTSAPKIYSGEESFIIEHYVRPFPVSPIKIKENYTTLFIFEFDPDVFDPKDSFIEIGNRLRNLTARTLLFLRSLRNIEWFISDGAFGSYERNVKSSKLGQRITVTGVENSTVEEEDWLVFFKDVHSDNFNSNALVRVDVAYKLSKNEHSNEYEIISANESPLYVYFPTDVETGVGFLMQGPYRTTPARDNIPRTDKWNKFLITQTGLLLVESLSTLKELGMLTYDVLNALTIDEKFQNDDHLLSEVALCVEKALRSHPLLLSTSGRYLKSEQAVLVGSAELPQIFTSEQLQLLLDSRVEVDWIPTSITAKKYPLLWRYLNKYLKIPEGDAEFLTRRMDELFFKAQTDDWLVNFYNFLKERRALWRPKQTFLSEGILRFKPFIRLESGAHVPPFNQNGHPLAYLPPIGGTTRFATVKQSLALSESAFGFFVELGLKEPDMVDDIIETILPAYYEAKNSGAVISDTQHQIDCQKISSALKTATPVSKKKLMENLNDCPFFRCQQFSNQTNSSCGYEKASKLYIYSQSLAQYFKCNHLAFYLSRAYDDLIESIAMELGASIDVKLFIQYYQGYCILKNGWGFHSRARDGFDPEAWIDGLDFALNMSDPIISAFIWNEILYKIPEQIKGVVETSSRKNFSDCERKHKFSKLGEILTTSAWIPDRCGKLHKPGKICLYDMPDGFKKNEHLARQLGIQLGNFQEAADQVGVNVDELLLLKELTQRFPEKLQELKHFLSQESNQNNVNRNLSATFCTDPSGSDNLSGDELFGIQETSASQVAEDTSEIQKNYGERLRELFSKKEQQKPIDEYKSDLCGAEAPLNNPERRREKITEEIKTDLEKEHQNSSEPRFQLVNKKVWDAQNSEAKVFLESEYSGKCQICQFVFHKRNGMPFFNGVRLISSRGANWLDRPGNILCLCANCAAKFMYGKVVLTELEEKVKSFKAVKEGGSQYLNIPISLCEEPQILTFSQRHAIDMQILVESNDVQNQKKHVSDANGCSFDMKLFGNYIHAELGKIKTGRISPGVPHLHKPILLLHALTMIYHDRIEANEFHFNNMRQELSELISQFNVNAKSNSASPEYPFYYLNNDLTAFWQLSKKFDLKTPPNLLGLVIQPGVYGSIKPSLFNDFITDKSKVLFTIAVIVKKWWKDSNVIENMLEKFELQGIPFLDGLLRG
jgi:hypothetical protein